MSRTRITLIALVAGIGVAATVGISALAQPPGRDQGQRARSGSPKDNDDGPPGGQRPHPEPGTVIPPFVRDVLKLSDDQKKKISDLESDVKAKLKTILSDDQMKEFEECMRHGPPRPNDDAGGQRGGPNSNGPKSRRGGQGNNFGERFDGPGMRDDDDRHARRDDNWRGPPPDDRRGPPPDDDRRGPPPEGRRGPPPDDDNYGPPPRGRRGPPPDDDRGSPPRDRQGPPPDDRRGSMPDDLDPARPAGSAAAEKQPALDRENVAKLFHKNVKISFTDTLLVVESDGIPDHSTGQFPNDHNPNTIRKQNYHFKIPLQPQIAERTSPLPMGPIGVAVNGVPFYNQYNAEGNNAVEGSTAEVFDSCCGHPDQMGRYHYHKYPVCIHNPFKEQEQAGKHSPLIGYAFDGFAIYGPNGEDGKPPQDLDECNGHSDSEHGYHYHVTAKSPYILGAYRGVVERSNFEHPPRGPG